MLVNYDIPWSPLKLEQRMGRVWRIGQEREVEVYNLFRNLRSEMLIVDKLYLKILAIREAVGSPPHLLGGSMRLYAEGAFTSIDKLYRGGFPGASDAVAQAFEEHGELALARAIIRGEERLLDEIARAILSKINALKEEISRKRIYPSTPAKEEEITLEQAGLPQEPGGLADPLVRQASKLAELLGYRPPGDIDSALRIFRSAAAVLKAEASSRPRRLLASGLKGRLYIIPVTLRAGEKLLYREPIGVLQKEGQSPEVLRASELLELLTRLAKEGLIEAPPEDGEIEVPKKVELVARSKLQKLAGRSLEKLGNLAEKLEAAGLEASPPRVETGVDHADIIIVEGLNSPATLGELAAVEYEDEEVIEKRLSVEEKAVEIVKMYERESGREPIDARQGNPYDIESRDPVTGELLRYIEIKSHSGYDATIELTRNEYEFAKQHPDKYWLYLVLGVETAKPVIIAIPDPARNIRFQEVRRTLVREEVRYVAKLENAWEQGGGETSPG